MDLKSALIEANCEDIVFFKSILLTRRYHESLQVPIVRKSSSSRKEAKGRSKENPKINIILEYREEEKGEKKGWLNVEGTVRDRDGE